MSDEARAAVLSDPAAAAARVRRPSEDAASYVSDEVKATMAPSAPLPWRKKSDGGEGMAAAVAALEGVTMPASGGSFVRAKSFGSVAPAPAITEVPEVPE
jgi:hypothetical protein